MTDPKTPSPRESVRIRRIVPPVTDGTLEYYTASPIKSGSDRQISVLEQMYGYYSP